MAAQTERGIPLSALCPKFLHTNSTSHTWPFSAIAELIDNAYDPDVKARQFWIDKTKVKDQNCLIFMDNGAGMDHDKMHKMLSFGFSDKQTINGHVPVGLYGNGFKSGSMRLGKDAIVFSKKGDTMCVGMLSQTYLQNTGAENVVVPIVTFRSVGGAICPMPGHEASLQDILHHSLFQTKDELFSELKAIHSPSSTSSTGTRIIIWNLRKTSSGTLEFDFRGDRYDIRIPAEVYENTKEQNKRLDCGIQSVPDSICSLRAYCSILYLKPRMQIIIRGQKVKTQLVSKSLAHILKNTYRPLFLSKAIPITFGYNTKSKEHYGIMLYHKNRLIKAYERVGCQLKANCIGVGVIGVIECDFLQPTHNKQDFDSTDEYRKTLYNVGIKLEEYWKEVRHRLKSTEPIEDIVKRPDQNWVQCDSCLKWRKLPDGIDTDKLSDNWYCHMNYDPQFRSCTVEQEPEDSDDEQPRYQNTYKQHERNKKMLEEINRQRMEQAKKKAEQEKKKEEQQKIAALTKKNAELMRKQQDLESRLRLCGPSSPAQATPSSLVNASPLTCAGSRPSDNMPVISEVISLSTTTPTRIKRGLVIGRGHDEAKKRRIMNDICSNTPDSPSTSTASPKSCSSPAMIIPDNHDGKEAALTNDDDDDDLMILESSSTPRPTQASFDLSKVKSERQDVPEVHVECNDEASMDSLTAMETLDFSSSFPVEQVSITTQTEQRPVKQEDENSGGKKDEERENNKQGLPPMERRTNQDQGTAGSMQGPPSDQVRSVTGPEKVNGEANESESNCSAAVQNLVNSDGEADNGETSMVWKKSATLKGPLLDPLDDKNLSLLEAQQQQDNLLELLDVASRERDESRAQAQLLTSQVEELQSSLLEFTQKMLKKEQCQQSTQTDAEEEQGEQQVLYLQATENTQQLQCKLDNMKTEGVEKDVQAEVEKNKEDHKSSEEGKGSPAGLSGYEIVDDDLACQIDFLLRELDRKNKEREELKNKLEGLEHQKNTLSACCQKLQKDLEEIKRQSEEVKVSMEERGTQTEFPNPQPEQIEANSAGPSNPGRVSTSGANQNETQGGPEREGGKGKPGCSHTLRELRQKVGRLLVTFVPALDLEQVNYDCEVIDEILDQVIDEIFCTKEAS